ncbi:recombinase family protein [Enterococcus sp. AD013-P3]|uniref:recombinase family protein n=1 Tax=Enterococcus sp. AD013-P3 TaxID=3411036 RepID=UPI003B95E4D6
MDYGYIRVSTINQDYKVQEDWAKGKDIPLENIYADKKSGKSIERSGLNELMEVLKENDRLYVYKLDRLSRDTKSALELLEYFRSKNITVIFGDLGTVDNTDVGDLVFTIFSAIATMERKRIVERTQAGRKWKRENIEGYKEGRKRKLSKKQVESMYKLWKSGETATEVAKLYNIGRTSFYTYMKEYEAENN